MPRTDHEYRTMISSHEVDDVGFPSISNMGYAIMVNSLKPNAIDISIRGSMKLEGKKFYLLVLADGILYDRRIGVLTRGLYKAEIPKTLTFIHKNVYPPYIYKPLVPQAVTISPMIVYLLSQNH